MGFLGYEIALNEEPATHAGDSGKVEWAYHRSHAVPEVFLRWGCCSLRLYTTATVRACTVSFVEEAKCVIEIKLFGQSSC